MNVTAADWMVMATIRDTATMHVSDLYRHPGLADIDVERVCERLSSEGYLERRRHCWHLAEAGNAFLAGVAERLSGAPAARSTTNTGEAP